MFGRNSVGVLLSLIAFALGVYWIFRSLPNHDEKSLRFAVAELDGLESLEREFGAFRDLLIRDTGLSLRFHSVPNRIASTEALISGQIDLLVVGPSEYVTIAAKTPVQIVVGLRRSEYYSTFLSRWYKGISSIQQLAGKKVALGDPGSTSKHLAPLLILEEAGVDIRSVELIHTSSVQIGWESLLAGDVDAFATTSDKYYSLLNRSPADIKNKIKLLHRGENLPGDLIVARAELSSEVVHAIRSNILKRSQEYIEAICKGEDNQKYLGMKWSGEVQDAEYDSTRQMIRLAGMEDLLRAK